MVALAYKQDIMPLALDVQTVSHGFTIKGEELPVLDNVNLRIAPGEFVALLGHSGCGKSTLLRLVAGLEQPRQGRILADEAPITGPDPSRVVVFQDPTLYPWLTVRQNVGLGPQARGTLKRDKERVESALRLVGLEAFGAAFPHQLSGGMAQRAALARALVNDPRLLILDEPLGKLDSLTRLTLQGEILRLWQDQGFTALLVTHDIEEALLLATRVVVFSPRPAHVLHEITVDLPYPRHRDDSRLLEKRRQILDLLGLKANW